MYLPSGEYSGVESLPGLVVIFFAAPPVTGTIKMSLLVLVACTSSMIAGVGDLFAVGRERVLILPAEREGRNVVRAGRQVDGAARQSSPADTMNRWLYLPSK